MTGEFLESAVPGLREGDILAGKYRISSVIGSGGMGVVVAAHHLHLDEKVAIKVLHPNVVGIAEAVDRFVREARSVVKIKSEHVVRVTDVDRLPDGSLYMVMEYLDGLDLSEWLAQKGPLPVELAVDFMLQACEAVADAHALGIVHRDLKPGNLFCASRSDGQPLIKVLDFGISKAMGSSFAGFNPGITGINVMLGSPLYMSPEQMHTPREVDTRTDIWALGAILYELLSGNVPFDGESVAEIWAHVNTHAPPPLAALRSEVPAGLEAVIFKCLQKRRDDRYANVADFAVALAPFGPKGSRNSAERISRILYAAGLSDSAITYPPSIRPEPAPVLAAALPLLNPSADTMSAFGYTKPGVGRGRIVTFAIVAVAIILAISLPFAILGKLKGVAHVKPMAVASGSASVALAPAARGVSVLPVAPGVPSARADVPAATSSNSVTETPAEATSASVAPIAQPPHHAQSAKPKGNRPTTSSSTKGLVPSASSSHKTTTTTPNWGGRL